MRILCPSCGTEQDIAMIPRWRRDARCSACFHGFTLPAGAVDVDQRLGAHAATYRRWRLIAGGLSVGALAAIMFAAGADQPLFPALQDALVVVDDVELKLSFDPPRCKTEPLVGNKFCIHFVEFSSPHVEPFVAKLLMGHGARGHLQSMGAAVPTETSEARPLRLLSQRAKTAALHVMIKAVIDKTNPGEPDSARAHIARSLPKRRSNTGRLGSWRYRYETSSGSALLMADRR